MSVSHAAAGRVSLVTGSSSGIGLAAVERLLGDPQAGSVVAVSRTATGNAALATLQAAHPGRLRRLDADLSVPGEIEDLAASLASWAPVLHQVLHCAGVLHGQGLMPEKSLQQLDAVAMQRSFTLNAFAPVLLLRALLPSLHAAGTACFASLSARVGSIADDRLGGWYSYRASKAAQNQLLKTAAIELRRSAPGVCVVLLHPGTVDSALSRPFQRGVPAEQLFTPARAACQLLAILDRLGPEDSGRFIAWDGSEIPW
jgi:NAD(P)-dependent dehydrogenase (short-subunit alcohol dehydrogenase family)